jgi:hypothetical protein
VKQRKTEFKKTVQKLKKVIINYCGDVEIKGIMGEHRWP